MAIAAWFPTSGVVEGGRTEGDVRDIGGWRQLLGEGKVSLRIHNARILDGPGEEGLKTHLTIEASVFVLIPMMVFA